MIGLRLGIFEQDLTIDTLRANDFEQAGRSMPKTELSDVECFFGLIQEPLFKNLHLRLSGLHVLKVLGDGLLQLLLHSIPFRLRFSMHSHRRPDFPLSAIPNGQCHTESCRDGLIAGFPMILADH